MTWDYKHDQPKRHTVLIGHNGSDQFYTLRINADGKARVIADPYLYQIAEGNITGHTPWTKTGYNGDIDPGTEHLWSVGGSYVFPTAKMGMEVISSSANDTAEGTGIRTVRIRYLDENYAEQTEVVTLNGTNAVATSAKNIIMVNNFRAVTTGTGKVAAGNIDIRHLDDTPIYSRIATGHTRARNAQYTVPYGKTLYVTSAMFSSIAAVAGADSLFTARYSYDDSTGTQIDFMMPFIEVGVQDGAFYREFEIPIKIPEMTDIEVVATSGNNNVICSSVLRGWLE